MVNYRHALTFLCGRLLCMASSQSCRLRVLAQGSNHVFNAITTERIGLHQAPTWKHLIIGFYI